MLKVDFLKKITVIKISSVYALVLGPTSKYSIYYWISNILQNSHKTEYSILYIQENLGIYWISRNI